MNEDKDFLTLADLDTGTSCIITKVHGRGGFRNRIIEMGFVRGKRVKIIKNAPLQDPIEYEILGSHVALRRSEAALIEVVREEDAANVNAFEYHGTLPHDAEKENAHKLLFENSIHIAIVGNPNSGKTTLFNQITGLHEKVGNYAGVTVDAKHGRVTHDNYTLDFFDLPGTYSITEYTPEELYVRQHLLKEMPDVVVNVIDASNLERNLYLTTQLIDMNVKVVIALNMSDELNKSGAVLNHILLGKLLGIPIVPTIASRNVGMEALMDKIIEVFEDQDPDARHVHINYGDVLEKKITYIRSLILKNDEIGNRFSGRYLSIKLLEKDQHVHELLKTASNLTEIDNAAKESIEQLENAYKEPVRTIISNAKFGFVNGALRETYKEAKVDKHEQTNRIDAFLTHPLLGFPILLIFMYLMFQGTFTLGAYPMEWIEMGVEFVGNWLGNILPEGWVHDLVLDGIIGGVGGVIVFLPNILFLFFFISIMEDTGYMARVAFIMDRVMHKIGLHGKSFIPLLMGFGCNVPAIMATRTLESKRDRLLTMLIIPFMSCSARLPVYILIISAFFPHHQGLVLFSVYLAGIALSIIMALIFKNTLFKGQNTPFVMELPPYRIPTLKNTTIHMWDKAVQYLKKMGTLILVASIAIWALGYFPKEVNYTQDYDSQIVQIENTISDEAEREDQIQTIEYEKASEHLEQSYIGRLGHWIEPVIMPLGFDWKIGVSIITGLAAKEIVVSTMGVLYQTDEETQGVEGLQSKLQQQLHKSGPHVGEKVFNPLVAYGLMLFILIYFPCAAALAAIKKESGWNWALFVMFYTTALAWLVSFAVYQIGMLF